jgi:hypothetical protein
MPKKAPAKKAPAKKAPAKKTPAKRTKAAPKTAPQKPQDGDTAPKKRGRPPKAPYVPKAPYSGSSHEISTEIEYNLEGEILTKGTKFKVKGMRSTFTFVRYVKNHTLDAEWIDCTDDETKMFRSFSTEKIAKVVKPKGVRKRRTSTS